MSRRTTALRGMAAVPAALLLLPGVAVAAPDITTSGIGDLKLGMPTQEAAARGWIGPSPIGCNAGWRPTRLRKHLHIGIWNERVMLIAATGRKIATPQGVRVGDPVKKLKARYPVQVVSRNIYDGSPIFGVPGSHLFFQTRKGRVALVELTDGFTPDGSEFEC